MAARVECHEGQGGGSGLWSTSGWSNKETADAECGQGGKGKNSKGIATDFKGVERVDWGAGVLPSDFSVLGACH